jgi:hypothetical protein
MRNLQMKCVHASSENTRDVTCYKAFLLVMSTQKEINPNYNVIQKIKIWIDILQAHMTQKETM